MERDFSDSTKQGLISFFSNKDNLYNDDISEDNLLDCQEASNVDFDIFADEIEAYTSAANNGVAFADIQLLGLISKINFVFEGAQQLDANYAGLVNIHATAATGNYITGLQIMADAISLDKLGKTEEEILCSIGQNPNGGIFGNSEYCKDILKDVNIPNKEYAYMLGLISEEAANKYINALVSSKDNVCDLSDEEKQQIITLYELYHKDYEDNMNDFLSPIYLYGYIGEAIDIKVITYTAPEPYRTILLENVGDMEILDVDIDNNESQAYYPNKKGIKFDIERWNGDYTTFFHECGHALDDLLVEGEGRLSTTYSKDDRYLINVLEADVRSVVTASVDDKMIEKGIPEADRENMRTEIVEGIMNCYDRAYDEPVFDEKTAEIYNLVKEDVKNGNTGTSSDIYSAFTGKLLETDAGHPALSKNKEDSYWTEGEYNKKTKEYTPRYSEDGTIVYKDSVPKEFFAEHFAAQMTRDPEELDGIYGIADASGNREERFHETIPYMEEMMEYALEISN